MEIRPEAVKHEEVRRVAFQGALTHANGRAQAEVASLTSGMADESPPREAGPHAVRKAPSGQVASPDRSGKRPRKDR